MKVPKGYKVMLKKVSYHTFEISKKEGWDMPKTVLDAVDMVTNIRNNPKGFFDSSKCSEECFFESIEEINYNEKT